MWGRVGSQETAILSTKLTKKAKKWPRGLNLISNLNFWPILPLGPNFQTDRTTGKKSIFFHETDPTYRALPYLEKVVYIAQHWF